MTGEVDTPEIVVYVVGGGPAKRLLSSGELAGQFKLRGCDGRPALATALSEAIPDVVVTSASFALGAGELLEWLRDNYLNLPVIVLIADADVETVVKCMKSGAYDVVADADAGKKLPEKIRSAAEDHRLMVQVNQLAEAYKRRGKFDELVGVSAAMQDIYATVQRVADSDASVFISGESGTGKELVARALHNLSSRKDQMFVPVNCAAIPKDLLESEVFGHERGSFTGAESQRIGSCEQADKGTLFLDEICEMEMGLQSKLLRFLQDHTFSRVGGTDVITVETRVITATNRNPLEQVEKGRLRDDLYYRLNVVPIEIAPLRDRPADIPVLAQSFLEAFGDKYNKYFVDFSADAMRMLLCYRWPGNVRELLNTIERIVVLANTDRITPDVLPDYIRRAAKDAQQPPLPVEEALKSVEGALRREATEKVLPLAEMEKRAILSALSECRGDISKAARTLGVSRATLYRKLAKYGVH